MPCHAMLYPLGSVSQGGLSLPLRTKIQTPRCGQTTLPGSYSCATWCDLHRQGGSMGQLVANVICASSIKHIFMTSLSAPFIQSPSQHGTCEIIARRTNCRLNVL
ncbi:hypothetical protein BO83DRAFT_377641, partial [Aspergillus eucalypticola CBS 122712]